MRVSDWNSEHPDLPTTISVNSSLKDIFTIMLQTPFPRDIYVVSTDNHLTGHISLKKIAHQLLPKYQPMHTRRQIMHHITGCTVKDLMDSEFIFAKPDEELEDIFPLLLERNLDELPIIDETGMLAGVVKLTTLLRHFVDQKETDTLCEI